MRAMLGVVRFVMMRMECRVESCWPGEGHRWSPTLVQDPHQRFDHDHHHKDSKACMLVVDQVCRGARPNLMKPF